MNGLLDLCILIYFRLLYISLLSYILYCTRNSVSRLRVVLIINDLFRYLSIYKEKRREERVLSIVSGSESWILIVFRSRQNGAHLSLLLGFPLPSLWFWLYLLHFVMTLRQQKMRIELVELKVF